MAERERRGVHTAGAYTIVGALIAAIGAVAGNWIPFSLPGSARPSRSEFEDVKAALARTSGQRDTAIGDLARATSELHARSEARDAAVQALAQCKAAQASGVRSSSDSRAPVEGGSPSTVAIDSKRLPPFQVTLDSCSHSAVGVTCEFLIENTGSAAATIALGSRKYPPVTLLHDMKGGEYRVAGASIGSRDWHSNEYSAALVSPHIRVRANVSFGEVPVESDGGTLELVLAAGASFQGAVFGHQASWRTLTWENIPFR